MRRALFYLSVGVALALGRPAWAEQPPSAPDPGGSPASPKGSEGANADLVRELLGQGDETDDLVWLYSNADEYAPSEVTGRPLPAPGLPGPGGGSPREWDPRWRKFGAWDYVLVGVGFGASAASVWIPPAPGRWQGRNSVDEWGRSHLGYDDYDAGRWAQDTSDVLLSFNVAFPLLVDSLVVSYWYRRSPVVAKQLALITVEAMAVATLFQGPTAGFASRERPYGRDCGSKLPAELDDCEQNKRYRSYFSGHTSASFATATVTCSHHLRHQLFGSPLADGLACGIAVSSAATVGLMRIVGRQHYVTDVLSGAVVGTLSGLGVPWLLHYRPQSGAISNLRLVPDGKGLALGGDF